MSQLMLNKIMIRGSRAELAYARQVLYDMDFNKIMPCPETLMITAGMTALDADLAFLYTIYGEDPEKAIQNGKNPQMINVIYPTWKKNYAGEIRKFKESVMTAFPENTVINPDAGHPFGQESGDISYLWGKGCEKAADCSDRVYVYVRKDELAFGSGDKDGDSKCPRSCADLAALGRIRYMNYLKYGHTNWQEWRDANWGLSWKESLEVEVETGDDYVFYYFVTPWSVPYGICHEVEKLISATSLEVIWDFAIEIRGGNCGCFIKKADENEFAFYNKTGDVEFANRVWGK